MKTDTSRPFLLVTGMHRSGTSMLMRLCNLLGVEIGDRLVPALPNDNETGFWEPQEAVEINESLLESFGTTHLGNEKFPPDWMNDRRIEPFLGRIHAMIARDYADMTLPGIKDPRISRLLPLWCHVLKAEGFTPHIILSVRHPLEVAQSLAKRNHISLEQGLALWFLYNKEAECYSRGYPRSFIHYPDLLSDWRQALRNAFFLAGLEWPEVSAATEDELKQFIRPSLRHNQAAEHTGLPAEIASLYLLLCSATTGEVDEIAIDRLAA